MNQPDSQSSSQSSSQSPSQKPVAGFLLSLIAAGLWGILPIALKELLAGMDAITIVWYRFLAAGLVLAAWLTFKGNLPNLVAATPTVRWILIISALGLCANYFLFSQSLNYVNGETSEAVIQLTTLFLILGGVVFYKEPFDGIQKLGTALIVVGLVLFFNDRLASFGSFENQETIGVLIVFVAAVTWTVYALLQKKLFKNFSSVQILFMIYGFSVVVLLPFISPAKLFQLSSFELALLGFCCINTLIAYGCFAEALNLWDASKVSAVLALAPLFTIGTLKVIVFFDPDYAFSDRLTAISLLGALFLVIGSVLAALMPVIKYKLRQKFR
jgi:drug/metabolite transporter (DMT)-like permease